MSEETQAAPTEPETPSPAQEPPQTEPATEPTPEKESDPIDEEFEAENEALKLGWKKEFSPRKPWQRKLSAKEFLERHFDGEIGTREFKTLLAEQKKEIAKLKHELHQSREFAVKSVQQIEQESREEKLAIIKARQRRAVEEGDVETWETLDKQKEELQRSPSKFKVPDVKADEPEKETKTTTPQPQLDTDTQAFLRDNPWFNQDAELTSYAVSLEQHFQRQGYSGRALYKQIGEEVRRTRPEKFENQNRERASTVNEVEEGRSSRRSSGGYEGLPADARRACDRFVAEGLADKQYKSKQEAQREFIRLYQS